MKKILLSMLVAITFFDAHAQLSIELVKDINQGSGDAFDMFSFSYSQLYNGKLYFKANDGINGDALWTTDGTEADTYMLKDINPDTGHAFIEGFTVYGGKLYFLADDGTHGRELWVTDGTDAGTTLFKDINPGSGHSHPTWFRVYDDKLYFSANDGAHGWELWVTDGTDAGTYMVKDIRSGGSSSSSSPSRFTLYNNKLYFVAYDGIHGEELWVTDGTEAGTYMVKDINPSNSSSDGPTNFAVYDGKLYFLANDGTHGYELWATDGTETGTYMLKDVNPGEGGLLSANFTSPPTPTVYNGKLYFGGLTGTPVYYLWETDGTEQGTQMVSGTNGLMFPYDLTEFNGLLYFGANDGIHGTQLWATDGTPSGSYMVKDIENVASIYGSNPGNFTEYNDKLYFSANEGTNGYELWVTDGTEAGTFKIAHDFDAHSADAMIPHYNLFRKVNNKLLFPAQYDGDLGWEVYVLTDATMDMIEYDRLSFGVYPNPASDLFTLSNVPTGSFLSLMDMTGREVYQHVVLNDQEVIETTGLTSGMYIIRIRNNETEATVKLIIKK